MNNIIKGKLLESETLVRQAANNTKERFSDSPDLSTEALPRIGPVLLAKMSPS